MEQRLSKARKSIRRDTLFSAYNADTSTAIANIFQYEWAGNTFGICTAGSDTPGMNSVINAVYRFGAYLGCNMIYIRQGFKGMTLGGDNFKEATFESQHDIINKGGTIIKCCAFPEFKERKSRLKAAENLVKAGLSKLILIGGNGTLRALNMLHGEWADLLRELFDQGRIDKEEVRRHRDLQVVLVLCSVEADIMGTEFSIGTNSTLTRITHAIDTIATTASSNNQAFVIEVFGETSGYLALTAGIACQATMVFTPEWPPEGDWHKELVSKVEADSKKGEGIIIIVAEGATDRSGRRIKAHQVADVLNCQGIETKVTILGPYQRGGHPTARDILFGLRAGAEAVVMLKELDDKNEKAMGAIGFYCNDVKKMDVSNILEQEDMFIKCLKEKRYVDAVRLKGTVFQDYLATYCMKSILQPAAILSIPNVRDTVRKVGILRLGHTTQGIASMMRTCVESLNYNGLKAMGVFDGFEGLIAGKLKELSPEIIQDWKLLSGDRLGSSDYLAAQIGISDIANAIKSHNLSGLIIMGSFEAFESLHQLDKAGTDHPSLSIPMCVVPITNINNIPGSDFSLGSDTAVNENLEFCQKLKRVAKGKAKTVYIIETLGGHCGFIAFLSALCCAADNVHTSQDPLNLDIILEDCVRLKHKIQKSIIDSGLIIQSDKANINYSTDVVHKVMTDVGKGVFECRKASIGQVTQGCVPSAYDRLLAYQIGIRTGQWMSNMIEEHVQRDGTVSVTSPNGKAILCCFGRRVSFSSVRSLVPEVDLVKKVPTFTWWKRLKPLMNIMATNPVESFISGCEEELEDQEEVFASKEDVAFNPLLHKWSDDNL